MQSLDEQKLYQLVNELSWRYFNKPFKHIARYNYRLRTTGGRYVLNKKAIEINPQYVLKMNGEDYIGIIKHELCHYHLHIEGKGYKHGDADFKKLLKKTGSPRHCRSLPEVRDQRRHKYRCTTCHYIYQRVRRVNVAKYRCGKCNGKIATVDE